MTLALLTAIHAHPILFALAAVGLIGMAVQTNLGTFNLNAWQQVMANCGAQVNTDATAGAHTLAANLCHGFMQNYLTCSAVGAANLTTRTAALMAADLLAQLGQQMAAGSAWEFTILNTNAGTLTLVGGTGVTISGTATVAQNVSRTWVVTYNGAQGAAAAFTFTNVASGAN